jgi:hypothetical protein
LSMLSAGNPPIEVLAMNSATAAVAPMVLPFAD